MHREIASGSLASGFTATLFSPLELVKTRMQVQVLDGWPHLYPNFVAGLRRIAAEDGLRLLWSHGFVGFVGRDLMYSGIRIGLYPRVREFISGRQRGEASLPQKIVAGAATGALGAAIANPLDVVRVRMSCEGGVVSAGGVLATGMRAGHAPRWRSSLHCLVECWQVEGVVRGLYRGVGATTARAALLSAGQLASYDHSKCLLLRHRWFEHDGRPLHIVAAIISGIVASVACNPADVLKSAIMSGRCPSGAGAGQSALGVARAILATQGPLGFMRGWSAAYARAGPAFFIQMPIVEELRRRFGCEAL